MSRNIAITTGPDTYLDHLGAICYVMEMPLIVTEDETYKAAKEFYPQIEVIKKDYLDLGLDYLASHFDTIFESGKFWGAEMGPLFELFFRKKMRFVFCPHGNSDKGFSLKNHVDQDVLLYYGAHMKDLLEKTGALSRVGHAVRTGNYRLPFYLNHKSFYDALAAERVLKKFSPEKKTILYAPTWQDGENASSFFSWTRTILDDLSLDFNVILKLHPFLERFHPCETHHILGQYTSKKGVCILTHFPAIYPLLFLSDIYLGDYSSIGYDYLAFNRPMYFFGTPDTKDVKPSAFIHQCGLVVPTKPTDLKEFIISTLEGNRQNFEAARSDVYHFAFGKEKEKKSLKNEILSTLKSS